MGGHITTPEAQVDWMGSGGGASPQSDVPITSLVLVSFVPSLCALDPWAITQTSDQL